MEPAPMLFQRQVVKVVAFFSLSDLLTLLGGNGAREHPFRELSDISWSSNAGYEQSRPLPIIINRQHLAADRLPRIGSQKHRKRRDIFRVDHFLDRLLGHRRDAHLVAAQQP
jgi:hypothetical protein